MADSGRADCHTDGHLATLEWTETPQSPMFVKIPIWHLKCSRCGFEDRGVYSSTPPNWELPPAAAVFRELVARGLTP